MKLALMMLLLSLCALGCAPFTTATPDGMIALNEGSWSVYDYRATTPQGVVVATRTIRMRENGDVPPADLDFWVDAAKLRLRTTAAYALLSEEETRSADGTPGVLLHFGRDADGDTYLYDVALFATDRFVHVLEAGGEASLFESARPAVEQAFAAYRIRR